MHRAAKVWPLPLTAPKTPHPGCESASECFALLLEQQVESQRGHHGVLGAMSCVLHQLGEGITLVSPSCWAAKKALAICGSKVTSPMLSGQQTNSFRSIGRGGTSATAASCWAP